MEREFLEDEKIIGRYLSIEESIYIALERLDIIIPGYVVSRSLNNRGHASLTGCPVCMVDDFVHVENCELSKINKNI